VINNVFIKKSGLYLNRSGITLYLCYILFFIWVVNHCTNSTFISVHVHLLPARVHDSTFPLVFRWRNTVCALRVSESLAQELELERKSRQQQQQQQQQAERDVKSPLQGEEYEREEM
jgi:hypothetical protein